MENEEIKKQLEALSGQIAELSKKVNQEEKVEENLSKKIENLYQLFTCKKEKLEEHVKENIPAYILGSFVGGIMFGFIAGRVKGK